MLACFSGELADLFIYLLGTLQRVALAWGRRHLAFPTEMRCSLVDKYLPMSQMPGHLNAFAAVRVQEQPIYVNHLGVWRMNRKQQER